VNEIDQRLKVYFSIPAERGSEDDDFLAKTRLTVATEEAMMTAG